MVIGSRHVRLHSVMRGFCITMIIIWNPWRDNFSEITSFSLTIMELCTNGMLCMSVKNYSIEFLMFDEIEKS